MNKDKNPHKHEEKIYSLISNIETTFVIVYDENLNTVWVSPPISRENFIRSIFFVLSYLLKPLYKKTHPWLYEEIVKLSNERSFNYKPKSRNSGSANSIAYNTRSNSNRLDNSVGEFNQEALQYAWQNSRRLIGIGRTCFVCSVKIDSEIFAFKMIDIFKPAYEALEELENEYNVLNSLKG